MDEQQIHSEAGATDYSPKVFISYSWSSPAHQDHVREIADRLINDAIDVIIDQYDLREGQDKYHFMEQMVTDPSVTHVLVFLDRRYTERADQRHAGVGAESEIMSKEVYSQVAQTKFIPVYCEINDRGEYFVPQFLKTRIGIDFTTAERINENWERLVRMLFGKPALVKPTRGQRPAYLDADYEPVSPSGGKLAVFKCAVLAGKPGLSWYRGDFLNTALEYAYSRKMPLQEEDDVLSLLRALLPLRDQLVDWFTLEENVNSSDEALTELLTKFLERLLPLNNPPAGQTSWSKWWNDAHVIFTYEVFLYLVAVLLNAGRYEVLRGIFETSLLNPEEIRIARPLARYESFCAHSEALWNRNKRLLLNRLSPIADVIKGRAARTDIPFKDLMQADMVIFVRALVTDECRWFPQTLVFAGYNEIFPLFARAEDKRQYQKIRKIFGNFNTEDLADKLLAALQPYRGTQTLQHVDILELLNIKRWATR